MSRYVGCRVSHKNVSSPRVFQSQGSGKGNYLPHPTPDNAGEGSQGTNAPAQLRSQDNIDAHCSTE